MIQNVGCQQNNLGQAHVSVGSTSADTRSLDPQPGKQDGATTKPGPRHNFEAGGGRSNPHCLRAPHIAVTARLLRH
jgi:hypothetical protein